MYVIWTVHFTYSTYIENSNLQQLYRHFKDTIWANIQENFHDIAKFDKYLVQVLKSEHAQDKTVYTLYYWTRKYNYKRVNRGQDVL